MLSHLIDLMENPDRYEASWSDGVLHIRRVDAEAPAINQSIQRDNFSRSNPMACYPHLAGVRDLAISAPKVPGSSVGQ